jgi:hypothetical protein
MNVFVQKRGTDEIKRVTSITDRDISEYFWKGNNRILYMKDSAAMKISICFQSTKMESARRI